MTLVDSLLLEDDIQSQWVVFSLQGHEYALPVGSVVEALRMVAVTPVPEAPPWLVGVINLRGRVIPVMDLRARLGLPPLAAGLNTPIIIAEAAGRTIGLIADAMVDVLTLPASMVQPPDTLDASNPFILAVAHSDGRLIMILGLKQLTTGPDLAEVLP